MLKLSKFKKNYRVNYRVIKIIYSTYFDDIIAEIEQSEEEIENCKTVIQVKKFSRQFFNLR